jgi:hypothetical protein
MQSSETPGVIRTNSTDGGYFHTLKYRAERRLFDPQRRGDRRWRGYSERPLGFGAGLATKV